MYSWKFHLTSWQMLLFNDHGPFFKARSTQARGQEDAASPRSRQAIRKVQQQSGSLSILKTTQWELFRCYSYGAAAQCFGLTVANAEGVFCRYKVPSFRLPGSHLMARGLTAKTHVLQLVHLATLIPCIQLRLGVCWVCSCKESNLLVYSFGELPKDLDHAIVWCCHQIVQKSTNQAFVRLWIGAAVFQTTPTRSTSPNWQRSYRQ